MTLHFELLPAIVFVAIMMCWFAFAAIFLFRKKPPPAPERKRESGSLFGVALQGLAYAIVWVARRRAFSPPFKVARPLEIAIAVITIGIAVASIWLVMVAVRTLGKEWSVTARLVEGHKLITAGPYHLVRNPIYTAMFGMLLATGLAISHWAALIVAIIIFAIGTQMRIRIEEKLLRGAFGAEFESYAETVPAVVPRLFSLTSKRSRGILL
jgi:protein-S-isoprenylcysteine O-methyltransferase Ste14